MQVPVFAVLHLPQSKTLTLTSMDSKENNNTGEAEMEIKEEANNNKDSNEDVKESKLKEGGGEENNNNNDNPSSFIPSIEGASPGKIFVGGLPKDTTEEAFTKHFQKYGKIVDSVIMKHRGTRIPRGFGFITYEDPAAVDAVIRDTHTFGGKQVEIKRTLPRGAISGKDFETKKIFVGGIPTTVNEDEFKNFFAKFGEVEEHLLMRDHNSGRSRGFGFISFSTEKAVDDLLIKGNRIEFAGAQVEIKKAEPKKPGGASAFAPPTKQPFSNPRPAFGRGRGRGFKDQHGGVESGSYSYSGGGRSRGYSGYGQSKFDGGHGGYGSTGIGSYRGDGGYGSTGVGSYRGEPSLGFSDRYGGGLGRGYGAGGYKEPSETYGRYGGAAGGYGGGYNFGPLGGSGGYDSGPGAGGYGGSGGYGSGGAGLYGGRQDYGGRGGYEGAPGGRYHPYSR